MLRKCLLAVLLTLVTAPAGAAVMATGIGPRVGFSVDPDQLVLGGHVVIGEVAPSITFDPNLELGFGDNLTTVAVNFDLHYHFVLRDTDWRPYAGAGIGVVFVDMDREPPLRDDSETGVGGELILGAGVPTRSGNRFFGELKFGLGDEIASLKLIAGWNFRL
jgi:hypothetical protein